MTDKLKEKIIDEFVSEMKVEGIQKSMLLELINKGIVPLKTMRDFLICKNYNKLIKENNNHVTHTLYDLSDMYDISEKQIRRIFSAGFRKFA